MMACDYIPICDVLGIFFSSPGKFYTAVSLSFEVAGHSSPASNASETWTNLAASNAGA